MRKERLNDDFVIEPEESDEHDNPGEYEESEEELLVFGKNHREKNDNLLKRFLRIFKH